MVGSSMSPRPVLGVDPGRLRWGEDNTYVRVCQRHFSEDAVLDPSVPSTCSSIRQ